MKPKASMDESSAIQGTSLAYPRTGKRGVPQQFPRRLYTMLESESKNQECCNEMLIQWSDSGQAFRIVDIEFFSTLILPKYFRTSKFSSFQRNLNLYGFSKVRRGPDSDMYAHPSFLKGRPDLLSQLKKCRYGGDKKSKSNGMNPEKESVTASHSNHEFTPLVADHHFKGLNVHANTSCSSPQLPITLDERNISRNSRAISPCSPCSSSQTSSQASLSSTIERIEYPMKGYRNSHFDSSTFMVATNRSLTIHDDNHSIDIKSYDNAFSNQVNESVDKSKLQGKLDLLALAAKAIST
mmetsp:Transcript_15118/g.17609  ORF Transcript_15118/g.17609 Transcript_15118/m.17609 type:complete len:296 (-) Transcript_15118:265-1152(-)